MADHLFTINGRVEAEAGRHSVAGLTVEAWDKDRVEDDHIGTTITDDEGLFHFEYTMASFDETDEGDDPIDQMPDLYFRVYRDEQLLLDSSHVIFWNVSNAEKVTLTIPETDPADDLICDVVPVGPGPELVDELRERLLAHQEIIEWFADSQYRLLHIDFPEPEQASRDKASPEETEEPDRFAATFYDYTRNRTVIASGLLANLDELLILPFCLQPYLSVAEFDWAVELVRADPDFREAFASHAVVAYRPMPPVIEVEELDGRVERTLAVGLLPNNSDFRHEIVGVNLIRQKIIRYEAGAPPTALANDNQCHPPPSAGQARVNKGTPGSVNVTVSMGGTVLWTFRVVRPSASSGTNGSGIELRYVNYRGKRVLYRAHAPILNVRYDGDVCGPYRDWQWEEGMIVANGTDVAPGFRLCPTPAQTILDTGSDAGNFLGTAIYVDGLEVVLVNEMHAGWYRYISEWRLHANGTIKPRFGFDAVSSSCTCEAHHHHVYWRFDFDIRTAGNNRVLEFNNPPLFGGSNWHTKSCEIRRTRNSARNRRWRVVNASSGEGYTLIPGSNDGSADSFGVGDMWALKYRGSEIDDGQGFTTNINLARANLDGFLTGEYINGKDVVLWYAGHFFHDESAGGNVSHIVGPDLVPYNW